MKFKVKNEMIEISSNIFVRKNDIFTVRIRKCPDVASRFVERSTGLRFFAKRKVTKETLSAWIVSVYVRGKGEYAFCPLSDDESGDVFTLNISEGHVHRNQLNNEAVCQAEARRLINCINEAP